MKKTIIAVSALALMIAGCAGNSPKSADSGAQVSKAEASAQTKTVDWKRPICIINEKGDTVKKWDYKLENGKVVSFHCTENKSVSFSPVRSLHVGHGFTAFLNDKGDIVKLKGDVEGEEEVMECVYDSEGKLIKYDGFEYVYDEEGRLIQENMGDYVCSGFEYVNKDTVRVMLPVGIEMLDGLGRFTYAEYDDSFSATFSYEGNCQTVDFDPYCEPEDTNCNPEVFKVYYLEH